jgi:hypothetical protein
MVVVIMYYNGGVVENGAQETSSLLGLFFGWWCGDAAIAVGVVIGQWVVYNGGAVCCRQWWRSWVFRKQSLNEKGLVILDKKQIVRHTVVSVKGKHNVVCDVASNQLREMPRGTSTFFFSF